MNEKKCDLLGCGNDQDPECCMFWHDPATTRGDHESVVMCRDCFKNGFDFRQIPGYCNAYGIKEVIPQSRALGDVLRQKASTPSPQVSTPTLQ